MNISYKWLREYLPTEMPADAVADALTSIGLETGGVERVESIRGGLRGLVVGKVLTCVEHPDSDHLHITTVDLGDGAATQIVCGAPNVAAGQTVIGATVGTVLYDPEGGEFKIKKSKIRGVESFGMICAEDEIGVGRSHDGIIVLPEGAAAPGTPAADYYGLSDDFVLEVDLTPNRIDAASHYGVARDLSAYLRCHHADSAPALTRPDVDGVPVQGEGSGVEVKVDAPDGCTRYSGITISGVKVAESPDWLKERLTAIGLRPINNVVDITNYILHGMGQPLHCFDRAKIKGDRIVVRRAAAGEKFVTLDGVERTLHPDDLMICNAEAPMCIAGVFGGLDSGVTDSTTDIFLESACFNPTSVRRTARRQGLSTDSSFRFERGVDPNGTLYALRLAVKLVLELAGGSVTGTLTDIYPEPVAPYPVALSYGAITRLLGEAIAPAKVDSILDSLEIAVTARTDADGGTMQLAVPTYRVDVRRPCDVIEDILRIYGYNNIAIPQTVHASLSYKTDVDAADDLRHLVSDCLTGAGWHEILNNSLTARDYYEGLESYPAARCVELLNPLSRDLCYMRQTMLFGGLESLAHNINRRSEDLAMYEFGNVYSTDGSAPAADAPLRPYTEGARLGMWLTGRVRAASWIEPAREATFYDLRAAVETVLTRIGLSKAEVVFKTASPAPDIYSAALRIETRSGKLLGTLGIVSPAMMRLTDLRREVYYAELDWDTLAAMARSRKTVFAPLPKTQEVRRDLSLLIDTDVTMARIEEVVRRSDRKLLRDVSLFDVYEGKGLPEGKKSYAIAITLRDDDKTLQDKAVDAVMTKVIANLRRELGAELR